MNHKKIIFYGFLIWLIMSLVGAFLFMFIPSTRNVFVVLMGLLVVYTFSRSLLYEKNMLSVGMVWFLINSVLNVVILHYLLDYDIYYSQWSFWIFYIIILLEPSVVKNLVK